MNKLNIVFLLFVFAFCFQSAYSQCCCGTISFAMVDAKGTPLLNNRLKIKEAGEQTTSNTSRITYDRGNSTENITRLAMRCTSGGIISVIYKGSEMKINFKFSMDKSAEGEIIFQKGNFIAEPTEQEFGKWGTEMVVRKATKNEMK